MYKKIMLSAALAAIALSFAACGKAENNNESALFSSAPNDAATADSTASISSDAIKELESVPGLSTDSLENEETALQNDTDTENAENNSTDAEAAIEPTSIDVGGLTLSAKEIPFSDSVKLSSENSDAAVYGDTMYLLDGRKLREFTLGSSAQEKNTTALSGAYSRIDTDPYGLVYLSRDRFDCAVLDENGELQPIDTTGELSMSKVMEYGLCRNGSAITKFSDESSGEWSSVSEREISFPENVSAVEFAGNHVLLARREDGTSSVSVCDYDGNTLASTTEGTVGDDITAMTETSGVIAASTCGDLCLWNDAGELIGRLTSDDTAALFGSSSPMMIKRLFEGDDGEMLAFCTEDETNEARLFRIMGL